MGDAQKTVMSMTSGFFGHVPKPQNQLRIFIFGDTRIPKTNQETSLEILVPQISKNWKSKILERLENAGTKK